MKDRKKLVLALIRAGVEAINSHNEELGLYEKLELVRLNSDNNSTQAVLGTDFEIYAYTQFGRVTYSKLRTIKEHNPAGATWFLMELEAADAELCRLLWMKDYYTIYAGVDGEEF